LTANDIPAATAGSALAAFWWADDLRVVRGSPRGAALRLWGISKDRPGRRLAAFFRRAARRI